MRNNHPSASWPYMSGGLCHLLPYLRSATTVIAHESSVTSTWATAEQPSAIVSLQMLPIDIKFLITIPLSKVHFTIRSKRMSSKGRMTSQDVRKYRWYQKLHRSLEGDQIPCWWPEKVRAGSKRKNQRASNGGCGSWKNIKLVRYNRQGRGTTRSTFRLWWVYYSKKCQHRCLTSRYKI